MTDMDGLTETADAKDARSPDSVAAEEIAPDPSAAAPEGPGHPGPASAGRTWRPLQTLASWFVEAPQAMGLWIVLGVAGGLILPFLGSVGFFDPWETHYAEVARQMAARDDYLYPFWKDAYFFSKPVLLFWLSAIGYKVIGAGQATDALPAGAEWAGRLPGALIALATVATLYQVARRLWSPRAGLLSALVLATTPFWLFMSRQAITDMLYVGPMSMALCLLALAFFHDEKREAWEQARLPGWLVALFGAALLPQLWEIARSGSFLNRVAWLGSESTTRLAFGGLLCALALAALVAFHRLARDPLIHAAAFLVAIATLGKGPHALLLTGMVLFLYFLISGDWRFLRRPALVSGIALYLLVSLPWYIAMSVFEGRDESRKTWVGRFILWDLLGRIGAGVHGDRGTFEYYVRYLAFGMFPWAGFFPLALLQSASAPLGARAQRTPTQRFTLFVALWAASFFVFFTATTTKFHHYIFPVVVPAALLIGGWLDAQWRADRRLPAGLAALLTLAMILIARDLAAEPWQLVDLFTYHYKSWKPDYYFPKDIPWHAWMGGAGFAAVAFFLYGLLRDWLSKSTSIVPHAMPPGGGLVVGSLLAALTFSVFAVHVYLNGMSQHWSQRWIMDTYYSMRKPGEPIISYQMDWKGETFYAHNEEIQIKKSASDLKKQVTKPGRDFILVQTDRFSRIESALGPEYKEKIKVVDRSNQKWFLVLVED